MKQMRETPRGSHFLSIVSYIVGGVVLLVSIVLMISLLGAAANLPNSLIALQALGLGPIVNLVVRPLQSALTIAAVVVFVIGLVLTLLLVAVGRLVTRLRTLALRVARLEAAAAPPAPPAPQPPVA